MSRRAPAEVMCVDRYVLLDVVGEGGMGIVYRAFDPELERLVALKLLHPTRGLGGTVAEGRARLQAEARALARLSHPHVIAIYDVGTFDAGVYLAMEFVEGQTLAEWASAAKRSVREILDAFLAAGGGLAAAHAAGLVHRDFKPDNVILGRDGRVRVIDFGIAAAHAPSAVTVSLLDKAISAEASDPAASSERSGDAVVGTRRYMAPEQHLGEAVDGRTDQFSFAVSLYELLHGEHPFGAGTDMQMAERVVEGHRAAPSTASDASAVPAWLDRALGRAMAPLAEDRYPSMDAFLVALRADPAAARRRWLGRAAAGLTLLLVALVPFALSRQKAQLCSDSGAKLAGVWDGPRREAVRRAMTSVPVPYAEAAFRGASQQLDAYAGAWTHARYEACAATRVRGEQSDEQLDLRMLCLDQRLDELRAQVESLANADRAIVERAATAVASLPPVAACSDVAALRTVVHPPRDAAARRELERIGRNVATERALLEAGKFAEADGVATTALADARSLAFAPLEAEAALMSGRIKDRLGDYGAAAQLFDDATIAAEAGRADVVAAEAWTQLVFIAAERQARPELARAFARHARAAVQRAGGGVDLEADLHSRLGIAAYRDGRLQESVAEGLRALELYEQAYGPGYFGVARALDDIATAEMDLGDLASALEHDQRALALREQSLGPDHPDVAIVLNNEGIVLKRLGRYPEAVAAYQRALTLRERSVGDVHPHTGAALYNLGEALAASGKLADGLTYEMRALGVFEHLLSADDPDLAEVHFGIGEILRAMGRLDDAEAHYARAVAIGEKALGKKDVTLANPLLGLARVSLARPGGAPAAVTLLERAMDLRSQREGDPVLLATLRGELGRALCAAGGDRERAQKLVAQATEELRAAGPSARVELEAIAAWRCGAGAYDGRPR